MVSKRNFTREFKLSVLREIGSKPAAEICREYNLKESLVSKWKRDYKKNPNGAFSGSGNIYKEDAKIAQYERLVGQLYAEITFLKKALENLQQRNTEEWVGRLSSK